MKAGISTLIYAAGLACLLLADVLASSLLPIEQQARWSFLRAGLYFFAPVVLLGLDNLLVRRPRLAPALLNRFRWQVPLLSLVMASLLAAFGKLPFLLGLVACIAVSTSVLGYQLYLGRARRVQAQVSFQSWKFLVLPVVVLVGSGLVAPTSFDAALTIALILTGVLTAAPIFAKSRRSIGQFDAARYEWGRRMGRRYLVTATLAAAAVYGEALLLGLVAGAEEQAYWFAHLTFFVFPATALGGLLAFLAIPTLRARPQIAQRLYTPAGGVAILVTALLVGSAVQFVGWAGWQLLDPTVGEPVAFLWTMAAIGAVLRLVYVFVSTYFALYGEVSLHDRLIQAQVASLVLGAAIATGLLVLHVSLLTAIVAGGLANIVGRSLIGLAIVVVSMHKQARDCT